MKRKEIKNLAQKIAKLELIIQNTNDAAESKRAQNEINELCSPSHVGSWEDIIAIDEMVQEILEKS